MKTNFSLFAAFALASVSLAHASPAAPYNLDIAAPVQYAGSDAASADFQASVLPSLLSVFGSKTTDAAANLSAVSLDPGAVTLAKDSHLRVYFVGEYASYTNTLGISTTGAGPLSPDAAVIFPNASSPMAWGGTERAGWAPLLPGDFVDLGNFLAGTKLDFFLLANSGSDVFSTSSSLNQDGLVHAFALSPAGSSYLLFGFEDMYGESVSALGDLVFAVQISPSHSGLAAPEPSLAIGGAFACVACFGLYRRRMR